MVADGVVIKDLARVPDGSVCSLFTYNSDEKAFENSEPTSSELFSKGNITYIPRELAYKENELIGSSTCYEKDVESDFDDFEESDEDPKDVFMKEAEELFHGSIATQQAQGQSQVKFLQNMRMELKSLRMTHN